MVAVIWSCACMVRHKTDVSIANSVLFIRVEFCVLLWVYRTTFLPLTMYTPCVARRGAVSLSLRPERSYACGTVVVAGLAASSVVTEVSLSVMLNVAFDVVRHWSSAWLSTMSVLVRAMTRCCGARGLLGVSSRWRVVLPCGRALSAEE